MRAGILPPLYVVTNRHQTGHRPLRSVLRETLQTGTRLVQLREKDLSTRRLLDVAQTILTRAKLALSPVLINDRLDVAMAVGTAGVHLRSDSLPVKEARKCLGPNRIIGVSVHSVDEAWHCQDDGADFVVLGPVFDTPSKRAFGPPLGLQAISGASAVCSLPIYAIGGITIDQVKKVREAGAYGVAVISAIWQSDNPFQVVKDFITRLDVPEHLVPPMK